MVPTKLTMGPTFHFWQRVFICFSLWQVQSTLELGNSQAEAPMHIYAHKTWGSFMIN
jgi:hypothetical protein